MALVGTIQIDYKGRVYMIPIKIWISDDYPKTPPTFYVEAKNDLKIPPNHPLVSAQGFVNYDSLFNWTNYPSLIELVISLCSAFSNEPPLKKVSNNPNNYSSEKPPQYQFLNTNYSPVQTVVPPVVPKAPKNYNEIYRPENQNPIRNEDSFKEKEADQIVRDTLIKKLENLKTEKLFSITKDLEEQERLESEFRRLIQLKNELSNSKLNQDLVEIKNSIELLKTWIEQNSPKDQENNFDIDSLPLANDSISSTILTLEVKDAAIQDIQYYLEKAFQNEIISLKQLLKVTRELSTHQYYQRAMKRKILNK